MFTKRLWSSLICLLFITNLAHAAMYDVEGFVYCNDGTTPLPNTPIYIFCDYTDANNIHHTNVFLGAAGTNNSGYYSLVTAIPAASATIHCSNERNGVTDKTVSFSASTGEVLMPHLVTSVPP